MTTQDPDKIKASRKRYYEKNKEKVLARNKAWKDANPDKVRKYNTVSRRKSGVDMKRRYGITPEDYESMLYRQGGCCAICGKEKPLQIDHCHDTGTVRGLLCFDCNTGIGKLNDDPDLLERAAAYLKLTALIEGNANGGG